MHVRSDTRASSTSRSWVSDMGSSERAWFEHFWGLKGNTESNMQCTCPFQQPQCYLFEQPARRCNFSPWPDRFGTETKQASCAGRLFLGWHWVSCRFKMRSICTIVHAPSLNHNITMMRIQASTGKAAEEALPEWCNAVVAITCVLPFRNTGSVVFFLQKCKNKTLSQWHSRCQENK